MEEETSTTPGASSLSRENCVFHCFARSGAGAWRSAGVANELANVFPMSLSDEHLKGIE